MPYDVPPLDRIKPEHFVPAIEQVIADAEKTFAKLRDDTVPADFENTAMPLSALFHDITRIRYVLDVLSNAQQSTEMSAARTAVMQKISEFTKTVFQDSTLAARFRAIQEPPAGEDNTLYKNLAFEFKTSGAFLDAAGQARIRELDGKLIALHGAFEDNLRESAQQQAVLFTNPADMAGLDSVEASFREAAQKAGHAEGWLVVPERLQVLSLLPIAESRHFRKSIFEALDRIGTQEPFNNEPLLKEIQQVRHERATLLDYPHHAAYALARTMPGNLATAKALMDRVAKGALPKFTENVGKVQAYAVENGGPQKLEPWDVAYWANRYSSAEFGFDAAKFSEYLPLDRAVEGFFKTAEATFGITFRENTSYARYHDDVRTYDVTDNATGESLGIFYADLYARSSEKGGGASAFQLQDKMPGKPNIVSMSMNLPKPEAGKTALLTLDDIETLFHEGGHALHALLGTRTRHPALQGIVASSEYVELFSMLQEKWPQQRECLDSFARHYQTGAPIPQELLDAYTKSGTFFSECGMLRLIQNSRRDFAFHSMDPAQYKDSAALHAKADFKHPLAAHIGSYAMPRFGHLVAENGAYAAGYYGYLWSRALRELAFKPFAENGLRDPETCARLKTLYSYGSSRDKQTAFDEYYGRPVTPAMLADALLESIGVDKPNHLARSSAIRAR